ncbi:MAG: filamentous hemagglutinin N-terminal domain-containing protein, partial [Gallionella sp.]|nr:filamentous hemagglutinin N-terminal domain-containing protein [Gallionella sp.]
MNVLAVAIACVFAAGQAQANGIGPTVVAGQAGFATAGDSLVITNSPGAIINWQSFSINAGESTRFIQSGPTSSVLNRVIGTDPSVILGTLTSNGRVFLINPGGILFGQGSRIDVAGLVASTLNLSNGDFLSGRLDLVGDTLAGKVENRGSITTPSGGSVYLVGAGVANSGIISSPQGDVILAAGQSVKIFDSSTPGVRVELTAKDNAAVNLGEILAHSGEVGIYGATLGNAGIINADQVGQDASGKIVLRAKQNVTLAESSRITASGDQGGDITIQSETGNTLVSGTIDASGTGVGQIGGTVHVLGQTVSLAGTVINATGDAGGGTVLVGGNFHGAGPEQNSQRTSLDGSVIISADASYSGNGGLIAVWSDGDTSISGTLMARGGSNSGDGGFIETSGKHVLLADSSRVNTLAPHGKAGMWLLDPVNWTIAAAGDETPASVVTSLAGSNRTILADNDITVAEAVSWATAQTLTLNAGHDVLVNAAMTASTAGAGIVLIAGNDVTATAALTASALGAVIDVSAGHNVSVDVITASGGGSVNLRGNNDVIVNGLITADTGLDAVVLLADNDGTGPGVAGGTVKFVGTGAVVTPRTIIRFNPDGYINTSAEIANYVTKVSAILDAKAWVFVKANDRTYNGTTSATAAFRGDPTVGSTKDVSLTGGAISFADKSAGVAKTANFSGYSIAGADSGDYALFAGAGSTTAAISQAPLTVTADNQSKTYGTAFTFSGSEFTSSGLQNSDTIDSVTLTSAGTAATAHV